MKPLLTSLSILALFSASLANAAVCKTWRANGPYTIGICAEKTERRTEATILSDLYLESAYAPGKMGIKRSTNKGKICKAMGFASYVSDSAVIEKKNTAILRGEQAIQGRFKVITELACK